MAPSAPGARAKKGSELKLSGTTLGTRFAIQMSVALALVMLGAGAFLYQQVLQKAAAIQENAFVEAVQIKGRSSGQAMEDLRREVEGLPPDTNTRVESAMPLQNAEIKAFADGKIQRHEVMYGEKHDKPGFLYQFEDVRPPLIVSAETKARAGQGLLALILEVTACVILVGALVAWLVGRGVSRPLEMIVDDIGQIARGDLHHRTRVRAGEIMMLAKSVDRLAVDLDEAQSAQLELSKRERELALAGEVREALLPAAMPSLAGYDVGALHVASPSPGGDFHDFIEHAGERVGLLVCEVSGRGIPGALVGAIARTYLRVELSSDQDVATALSRANREIARDVQRGIYATALYALVDGAEAVATVACAGHKSPVVRFTASDGKVRLVHPEGIALGFDKGPVFDKSLQVLRVPLEVGDRIVLANTGPVRVRNPKGEELGEKAFYRLVMEHARRPTSDMLAQLRRALEAFAAGEPFPNDLSIVSVSRQA